LMVGGTGGSGIRVELAGANNFTGDTVINTGAKLTLGNNLALQNSALNLGSAGGFFALSNGTNTGRITGDVASPSPTFGGLIGSRNLIAAFSTTAGNNESLLSAAAVTGFTLNVSTGKTHTYAGAIGGFGAGASGSTGGAATLTKTGEGTQILTGTSSYTGATTISGGTLALGAAGAISGSASLLISAGGTLDTSAKPTYAIAASQTLEIGIDPMGAGTTGKILAAGLDVSNATVTVTAAAPLDDPAYVLATYTTLTGNFLSPPTIPPGYALDYAYEGNKIALVSTGAPVGFAAWQLANGTTGNRAADHDGDGVPNGIENFLGGSTNTTDPTPLPSVDASSASITWTKSPSYTGAYGTDFVVESSDTLSGDWMPQTLGGTVTISGNNVTYRFPTPLSGKKFARLRVSGP
jgi:autotransporter-associated beta strand protein